jgi:hypothetical protein
MILSRWMKMQKSRSMSGFFVFNILQRTIEALLETAILMRLSKACA